MHDVTIGVLLDEEFDYSIGVLEGIRDFARTRPDWRVLPLPQAAGEGLLTRLVRSGGLQALAGAFMSDRWIENRLPATLPLINTSNLSQVTRICSVTADDAAVGKLVADHFCELGWGRAGVISDRATYASQVRREGFIAAGHERGLLISEPDDAGTFRLETAWETWVERLQGEIAVFCTSDHLARRFWEVCKAAGPAVSNRVALTGVGDSLAERVISGLDLTSVALPARRVGVRAGARLARALEGDYEITHEKLLPETLVMRGSTARFASPDDVVSRAMGFAIHALAENIGVDELARRTGVSRRALELRFRKAFSRAPARIIRDLRIEHARRLLVETDLSVAEVAARVGGGSVQAFTTLFRRVCGCPPAAYRRKQREKRP